MAEDYGVFEGEGLAWHPYKMGKRWYVWKVENKRLVVTRGGS